MIVVSPEVFERMKHQQNEETVAHSSLDKELFEILKQKNVSDFDKWVMYSEILKRHLNIIERLRQPLQIPVLQQEKVIEPPRKRKHEEEVKTLRAQMLEKIPKTYIKKAEKLYDSFQANTSIRWDDYTGEVTIKSEKIPGSNITDLIESSLRRRRKHLPVGWTEFSNLLQQTPNKKKKYLNWEHFEL